MRRLLIVLLVVLPQVALAGAPAAETLDPDLWAAASTAGFRALVYRECSPEHCWTRLFVQSEKLASSPGGSRCTAEVQELGYGSFVTEVAWRREADTEQLEARLVAKVSPSHGGFEPYEATVIVREDCGYEVVPPPNA